MESYALSCSLVALSLLLNSPGIHLMLIIASARQAVDAKRSDPGQESEVSRSSAVEAEHCGKFSFLGHMDMMSQGKAATVQVSVSNWDKKGKITKV